MKPLMTICCLALLVLVLPKDSFATEANLAKAKEQVVNIEQKVDAFFQDVGRYPDNEEGLTVLLENSKNLQGWKGPYLTQQDIVDPWGMKIRYITPHSMAKKGYGVYSVGIDTVDSVGYVDDITSWSKVDESYYVKPKEAFPIKAVFGIGILIIIFAGEYARRKSKNKSEG